MVKRTPPHRPSSTTAATIRLTSGATTSTAGNATTHAPSQAVSQVKNTPSMKPRARIVAIPATMNDINPDRSSPNR